MKKLKIVALMAAIGLSLCLAVNVNIASAVPFETGDLFAGTGSGNVLHYRGATLLDTYSTGAGGFETGMAFDSTGNLYVTNFSASTVTRFDDTGTVIAPNPFLTNDAGAHNESIVFDAAGNFYVGQPDGTRDILKFAADGTFLARYDVAADFRGSDWIDLAADQATMYYASEGRAIQRYDVATDTQLTNFAALPGSGNAYALRLLGDGGLLVADSGNIKRLDSTGSVIQTYDVAGQDYWFALNLDPDGSTFWSADFYTGLIQQFDIDTGAALVSVDTGTPIWGLTLYGEITQAIPTPEPATLLLFGVGLAGIGIARKRLRS